MWQWKATSLVSDVLILVTVIHQCSCGSFFGGTSEPQVVRTPESRFKDLHQQGYPWEPKYIWITVPGVTKPLRVHYVDEGPAYATETLLLLHGTPTWSYLWRTMVPSFLNAGYRVVMIDFIGFGRSDKLTAVDAYSHDLHVGTLMGLVQTLDLKGVTLAAQDWGGMTGLSAISREPERYSRVALFNTWLPQGDILSTPKSILQNAPVLSWITLNNALGRAQPVSTIMKIASTARGLALEGYTAPYPEKMFVAGPAAWPAMVPMSPTGPVAREFQRVGKFLTTWMKPAMVGYSERELFTLAGRDFFQKVLPNACPAEIPDAGHFLQEDQGPLLSNIIINWIENGCN